MRKVRGWLAGEDYCQAVTPAGGSDAPAERHCLREQRDFLLRFERQLALSSIRECPVKAVLGRAETANDIT